MLASLARDLGPGFTPLVVPQSEVPLDVAVATYLFNSQLIARADGRFLLVAPAEVREHPATSAFLDRLVRCGRRRSRRSRSSTCARACATAAVPRACGCASR